MTQIYADRDFEEPRSSQPVVLIVAAVLLTLGLWQLSGQGWRQAALYGVGTALGLVLYHAAFGFTSAYRRMIVERDVTAVQAQLIMLAAATVLFAPALADGTLWGRSVVGAVAPLGTQVAVGAFLFGLGMQLGGGCGSGTLFTVGGGSPRMVLTLIAFCAGSFWASLHMQWWVNTPHLPAISLGVEFGWIGGVALQLGLLALIWFGLRRWGRASRHVPAPISARRFLQGPWPLIWGALALALLNWITLGISGHPWTITWAFTLWGAKAATLLGWSPVGDWFWTGGFTERALASDLLHDETSVMNFGIIIGALFAAAMAGRFAPVFRISPGSLVAAVIGGLLMGYGARIGFGCNIGAFFSGIASTSLHGWLWIIFALAGTWLGVKLRPFFSLTN